MHFSNSVRGRSLLAVAGILLWASSGTTGALAGDDGEAPIWTGIATTVGLAKDPNDVTIDYHERGKLVLPPKMDLPPPGLHSAAADSSWPVEQEVRRAKKAKQAELNAYHAIPNGHLVQPLIKPNSPVTMDATAGMGPGQALCAHPNAAGACPEKPSATASWNPLTWVGLAKKPGTVLGPEPDRDWLTDPPQGLRAPVEGVGAVADGN